MAEKTQWRVDMVLSSSDRDKIQEPVATFDIHLGDGQEPISFEAGEKELETLFKDLERIQRQLDSIS